MPIVENKDAGIYSIEERQTDNVFQLGLSMWKTELIDGIRSQLASCLMTEVSKDRSRIVSNQDCISTCLESFLLIDAMKNGSSIYADLFEKPLIENTRVFYSEWSTRACTLSCIDFISEALEFLDHETERAIKYYPYLCGEIVNLFGEILVDQQRDFLNFSVCKLIDTEQEDVLRKFYQLFKTTNQCDKLLKTFNLHVKAKVNSLLADIPNDISAHSYFVKKILAERDYFIRLIDQVFGGTSSFLREMDESFEQVINSSLRFVAEDTASKTSEPISSDQIPNSIRAAQYMNHYMDEVLRCNEQQSFTNEKLEEKISAVISLSKYIKEMDLFWQDYQKSLSCRLLLNRTASLKLEESTVAKLNEACSNELAFKCKLMIADVKSAEIINNEFQNYLTDCNISLPLSHQCNVLSESYWPLKVKNPTIDLNCIPSLADYRVHFEAFYKTKYSKRNLRWALSACTAECKILYTDDGRQYTLQLFALHAGVLSIFETRDVDQMVMEDLRLNLTPIKSASADRPEVKCDEEEIVKNAVKPLVDAGFLKLLHPDDLSSTNEYTDGSIIALNRAYTNPDINVNLIYDSALLNSEEDKGRKVQKETQGGCECFIQATIMRILKQEKSIKHAELLKRVKEEDRGCFHPPVNKIKISIEKLIDQGYLERNPKDLHEYRYLA
ncbi:hypothetical protein ACTXT7_015637 [Hymenolepis weldensis]